MKRKKVDLVPLICVIVIILAIVIDSMTARLGANAGAKASEIPADAATLTGSAPDETLLLPLLNSIPPEYGSINVTMGYPMKGSAIYTLADAVGRMQLRLRHRDDGWYFYHREVREVFSSSLFSMMLSPEEKQRVAEVKRQAKYYIPMKDLQGGPVMEMVFKPVVQDIKNPSAAQNKALCRY